MESSFTRWVDQHLRSQAEKVQTAESQNFLEELDDEQSSALERVESYHKFLNEKSSLELEKALLEEMPPELFEELGLPSHTIPRIYRPLPRWSDRIEGNVEQVSNHLCDLAVLKRNYIDKAVTSLYEGLPLPEGAKVILFTYVIADGLGDFAAQCAIAQLLIEEFPHLDIELVTLVHESVRIELPLKGAIIPYKSKESAHFSKFSEKVMKAMASADLVFQVATCYPFWDELKKTFKGPAFEFLGEYGFSDLPEYATSTGAKCMGLHFLEKGILINQRLSSQCEAKDAVQKLFGDQYQTSHHLHIGYLSSEKGYYLFLGALLKFHAECDRSIDIVFPNTDHLMASLEKYLYDSKGGFPLLAKYGVKEIEIHHKGNRWLIETAPSGKKLRFFSFGRLSMKDFEALVALSHPIMGCRGNQSFSLAVSAGKLPFYEVQVHTRPFLKDLIGLAKHLLPEHSQVGEYLALFLEVYDLNLQEVGEQLGEILKSSEVSRGIQELNKIIRTEYSVNPYVCNLVRRALSSSGQYKIEEELVDLFTRGEVSFPQLMHRIKKALAENR